MSSRPVFGSLLSEIIDLKKLLKTKTKLEKQGYEFYYDSWNTSAKIFKDGKCVTDSLEGDNEADATRKVINQLLERIKPKKK